MLIINADDFGRSRLATDRILSCYDQGAVTSTSAMVFMEDSERAADLAKDCGIDVGLHLNFTQKLMQSVPNSLICEYQERIASFLTRYRYGFMFYNPALRKQFRYVFQVQLAEFERLYDKSPSHMDGHHHMHLCANMLIDGIIPKGQKVRRNFFFARGEKSLPNRLYRGVIDKWLARRYVTTDYLFSLADCINTARLARVLDIAKTSRVELETHPELAPEYEWLMCDTCIQALYGIERGTYAQLELSVYAMNNSSSRNE